MPGSGDRAQQPSAALSGQGRCWLPICAERSAFTVQPTVRVDGDQRAWRTLGPVGLETCAAHLGETIRFEGDGYHGYLVRPVR